MTESELLNSIKENPSLFSEIFKLYYKAIFGYILRRIGDFDETADVAAETFYKAYANIRNFSYRGVSIKVWLYRIAINELNQLYRNKRRDKLLFARLDFSDKELFSHYLAQDREEYELELENHQQFVAVLEALKTLPVKYQEVISLRYFEGKSNKEIAEILNINEGTLKSLLSRGIEKLRIKCNL